MQVTHVYDNVTKFTILEEFSRNPINPYGKTKFDDEIYLKHK